MMIHTRLFAHIVSVALTNGIHVSPDLGVVSVEAVKLHIQMSNENRCILVAAASSLTRTSC